MSEQVQPVMAWEGSELNITPPVVWWHRQDGRYQVEIHHGEEESWQQAHLYIWDRQQGNALVYQVRVFLEEGVRVAGPELDVLVSWKRIAMWYADHTVRDAQRQLS